MFHLPISTHSLGSPEIDSLWLVLVRSIGPDPVLLSPGVDSLKVLFFKLEIVKVGLDRQSLINTFESYPDPLWSNRLRNDDKALMGAPSNENLSWGLVDFLGNFLDGGGVDDSRFAGNVVSKR
jgi:hypothetical protein